MSAVPAESATVRAAPPRLQVLGPDDLHRAPVEAFIREVYRERFGADVRRFAPWLVAQRDAGGAIVAAAGWRAARGAPLFLERYLDAPVERLLDTARERIVEVGHLAAGRAGEGRRLILALGPLLAAEGFDWVVSTLTEELRLLFLRLGIAPRALGIADAARLGDEAAQWGRYYEHRPVVLAGPLAPALQVLAKRRAAA